ncbi:phosphorothioated DNA-binding restriction endonuclease [Streptomyces alkaliterrae]|uniref:HNH endonuclease n=1 Tax=Streptomyces alkaliterrae TaxID=2213162 RepID=A0A5P0YU69_9ACTN|nr:HNH endonuclease [Streptomyces alkaliterrae]MBB1255174.1 HNH endonuclease [Streptomyces alkaliterrae]MBB1261140.1 HNH endonuclease [Streptomyces alkaliterrae]MQS03167.1 restriction endonuclease [Streptomyces alkaliterrae]
MDWLERAATLRQWTKGGTRAPHKPLLLLYALSRFQEDADGELFYSAVEEDLKRLLAEYGPPNRTTPAYPFHHLVSDGVWEVRTDRGPGSPGSGVRELRAAGAAGRLTSELRTALRREPSLLDRMARLLLDRHFPPSLHGELCEAVGLELEPAETGRASPARRRRDRRMRERVLTAYEYRCAFCGYDGRIGAVPVGLEAAHVRWWAFGGPDDVDNGLCLCSLHHKLFDKGVLGVGRAAPRSSEAEGGGSHRILVSQRFVGHSPAAREHVTALAGRPLIGPQPGVRPVATHHLSWHTGQVFHGNPRPAADLPRTRSGGGASGRPQVSPRTPTG